MADGFRLIELARLVVDEVDTLAAWRRAVHSDEQLMESVQSIAANIREAFGRGTIRQRDQFLGYARASADETDEHLRRHFRRKTIPPDSYWRRHNRLTLISKMITEIMEGS